MVVTDGVVVRSVVVGVVDVLDGVLLVVVTTVVVGVGSLFAL